MEQQSDQEKSSLRRYYSRLRKELDFQWQSSSSKRICAAIRELPVYQESECAAFFIPWGAEPDLRELFFEKRTFLPRFSTELEGYEMVEITDLGKDLLPGKYGIPEPSPELPAAAPELIREDLNDTYSINEVMLNEANVSRLEGFYVANLSMKIEIN